MPTHTEHLISTAEAAGRLAITPHTLRAWVTAGTVPVVRFGRLMRFDPDDLAALVAAHRDRAA